MRVAVVVNCLKMGGMERVAVNLSDAFYEQGHNVDLIYLKNRKREISPRNEQVPVHLFNLKKAAICTGYGALWLLLCKILNLFLKKTFPLWFAYLEAKIFEKKLSKLEMKQGKFDLIVFRGQGTFEHLWPLHDSRFVYVCENIQKKNMYGNLSKWIFSNLFNQRKVACVSEGALASFQDMVDTHQLCTQKHLMISNPNDFNKIINDANLISSKLHNKPYILGLGRLVPQKNFILLVEAYHQLLETKDVNHDLIIVGAGKDRKNIEKRIIELKLTSRVHLKGQQNNPFPWYKQADLFVLSSKFEGLGMVLIESLACGTKVVSTDSKGGVRQIMQGALEPFLAQETPESLAESIDMALNSPWNAEFDSYIEETLNRFDGKTIVNQYINSFVES